MLTYVNLIMFICNVHVNMQNNYVNMRGNYANMRISHITCQHKYMLHVEIIYVTYRGRGILLLLNQLNYSGFWFYIIRPDGTIRCCPGEAWNISLRSCQRKWNQTLYVFSDVNQFFICI